MKTLRLILLAAAALLACLLSPPARAATVGMIQTTEGRIYLYDDAGLCTGRALRAEWVPGSGIGVVGGCWKQGQAEPGVVRVVFFDADIVHAPVEAVQPVRAL
jgi:hypothetical protein